MDVSASSLRKSILMKPNPASSRKGERKSHKLLISGMKDDITVEFTSTVKKIKDSYKHP